MNVHYVTTTIPFVNAPPHIGFACELVQADALARYHRLRGREVRFQTGTDENAFKNVLTAEAAGIPVLSFVDRNAAHFRALCSVLNISLDHFLQTSSASHRISVHAFFDRLERDDLYEKEWRGLYCTGCEDY